MGVKTALIYSKNIRNACTKLVLSFAFIAAASSLCYSQEYFSDPLPLPSLQGILELSDQKIHNTLQEISYNSSLHPAHTDPETGLWDKKAMSREEWTSGFFAGQLWYMYKLTGDQNWKELAIDWTNDLKKVSEVATDHDIGFRIFSSYGNGYKLTGKLEYYQTILQAAAALSKRFDPDIGAIKSWEWIGNYPVIIDNLLNLELLFWAAENGGRKEWYDMALTHAQTSLKHHMRPDGTSYHIVDFDDHGNVNWKDTRQGYGPNSVWARGQAWAIYGFAMVYRFTQKKEFLDAAESAANYFIENLPDDHVPIYDFKEPIPSVQSKDASAAAIAASGFLELYQFTLNTTYFDSAAEILRSLMSDNYTSYNAETSSILMKSTLHRGSSNRGTSYADYYLLEALDRHYSLTHGQLNQLEVQSFLHLRQNFPNPFNNQTRIYYSIDSDNDVQLRVYDAAGRKVKTLVNQFLPAGNYSVIFDASDLSSGLYFYSLKSGRDIITRKLTLIK